MRSITGRSDKLRHVVGISSKEVNVRGHNLMDSFILVLQVRELIR